MFKKKIDFNNEELDDGTMVSVAESYIADKFIRWKRPSEVPDFTWDLISKCWHGDVSERPSFSDIATILDDNVEMWALEGTDMAELSRYIDSLKHYSNA